MVDCLSFDIKNHPDIVKIATETEKGICQINVDFTYWLTKWPDLAITLLVKAADGTIYIPSYSIEDGILSWVIQESDTAIPGIGMMEFVGESDDKRVVSDTIKLKVAPRMSGVVQDTPPGTSSSWVDEVLAASEEAKAQAESAKSSALIASEASIMANESLDTVVSKEQAITEEVDEAIKYSEEAKNAVSEIKGISAKAETLDPGSDATANYNSDTGVITIGVPKGEKGDTGATPNLSIGNVESIPNDQNGSASITGTAEEPVLNLKLPKGEKGDTGSTPNLTIGNVTTLPSGSLASVDITGTDTNPKLNLGIPTGDTGATPNIQIGSVTTLEAGKKAIADISGTAEEPLLNLGIPMGEKGNTGVTPNLTIGTVTTLDPGSDAIADITGTAEEPVLNFGIPRGIQGAPGKTGNAPAIIVTEGPASVIETDIAAADYPLEPISTISFVQEGEGDPSPDNIRPITGWDTINLTRCGKNLLDLSNAYIDGWNIVNIPNLLLPNKKYSYSVISSNVNLALFIANNIQTGKADKQLMLSGSYLAEGSSVSFTTPALIEDKPYLILAGQIPEVNLEEVKVQLEVSDVSDYEPYQGDDYTSTLPETIYGGTYNWATGELVVDQGIIVFDGENIKFSLAGNVPNSDNEYYWNGTYYTAPNAIWGRPNSVSHFVNSDFSSAESYKFIYTSSIEMAKYDISTPEELNEYCKEQYSLGAPLTIIYPMEPQTYYLSPQEILALEGTNTLFSDCGETQVTFTADTKKYIDKKIEELASSSVSYEALASAYDEGASQ